MNRENGKRSRNSAAFFIWKETNVSRGTF